MIDLLLRYVDTCSEMKVFFFHNLSDGLHCVILADRPDGLGYHRLNWIR